MENSEAEITQDSNTSKDDEISLLDLFLVLLKHKKLIISTTLAAMIAIVIIAIISIKLPAEKSFLPNEYTPKALMLINDKSSSSSGTIASMLSSSGLGSLASLAGVSSGSTNSGLALYLASTNIFLDSIVDKFDLISKYKIEKFPRANSREILKKKLTAEYDEDSGVYSLSFKDTDPALAQSIVNYAVDYMENIFDEMGIDQNKLELKNLNSNIQTSYDKIIDLQKKIQKIESSVSYGTTAASIPAITLDTTILKTELSAQQSIYAQLKTQAELLRITMASEKPVFQVIEKAEIPDRKSGPSRGMLCIIVTFAAFFISVFISFLLNAIQNIKQDSSFMEKLHNINKKK